MTDSDASPEAVPFRVRFLRGVSLTLGAVVALFVATYLYGQTLPADHSARASVTVSAPVGEVFDLVASPGKADQWRPEVASVSALDPVDGRERFREEGLEALTIEVREKVPAERYVVAVVEHPDFEGTWTWTFESEGQATRVTVEEQGTVHNPIFRVLMHHVIGETATMDGQLAALQDHFGGS